jgi:hypothetical protein
MWELGYTSPRLLNPSSTQGYVTSYKLWSLYFYGNSFPYSIYGDRLCGLVVRVLGYRSGGPGSIPGTIRFCGKKKGKQVVGLERGPLSLVSTTEELLDKKVAASV